MFLGGFVLTTNCQVESFRLPSSAAFFARKEGDLASLNGTWDACLQYFFGEGGGFRGCCWGVGMRVAKDPKPQTRSLLPRISIFKSGAVRWKSRAAESRNIGALIIAYTFWGAPFDNYSIVGPQTLF